MKLFSFFVWTLFLSIPCFGQKGPVINHQAIHFQIGSGADTIDFIVVDTQLTEKKPVFLWCQGSLPVPLFVEVEDYGPYMFGGGINNFGYQKIVENYHLVVISMPHTPVVAKKEQVNDRFQYVPDKLTGDTYFQPFIKADYLDNYVYRAQAVLSFLKKQQWVQPARLVVSGHSQGAKVAAKVALANKDVTHLGLFSPNPFGRVDEFIRRARLDAQLGRISWEEADSIMNHYYDFFETAHQTDSLRSNPSLKAWNSFSETFFDDWLELDIPIYLAYGTEDRAADLCDVVPLFFIKAGKNNLTLRRYLRLGHNFFGVDEKGRTNYDIAHWSEVMHAFLKWMQ